MSTLGNFGVPLSDGVQRGVLAPKTKYRWRVRSINFGPFGSQDDLTWNIATVSKPSITHEDVAIHSYNSTAYYAGKHSWGTIEMTLRDTYSNSASRLVGAQLQKQLNHFEQRGVPAGQNYKFTMFIESLDGQTDVPVELWTVEGGFLQSVNWGDLDYTDSNPQMISCTIRADNFTYDVMDEFASIDESNAILTTGFDPAINTFNGV